MTAPRASMLLAGGAALMLASPPATAQVNDGIVLNIMRECAKINDPTARLACYDNNIRSAGGAPRSSVPGEMQPPQGGRGAPAAQQGFGSEDLRTPPPPPPVQASGPEGFGSEDVRARSPQRFETPAGQVDEIRARVSAVRQREPGIYLVTLEDGAQWLFSDSVGQFFRPPSKGDTVEIQRAALGSFLMRIGKQEAVRVERIK